MYIGHMLETSMKSINRNAFVTPCWIYEKANILLSQQGFACMVKKFLVFFKLKLRLLIIFPFLFFFPPRLTLMAQLSQSKMFL
jgi:hypothetical protein